ncbi:hypothetical protein [Massilia glaciei]|nr:hypothetical protein [Massilia glaciei]
MKPSLIRWWPLMGAMLAIVPASAQPSASTAAADGAGKAAPAEAPCYRA